MCTLCDWYLLTSSDSSENCPPGNPTPANTRPWTPCSMRSSLMCPALSPNSRAFIILFSLSPSHRALPSIRPQLRCYFLEKPSLSPHNNNNKIGSGHPSMFSLVLCSTPLLLWPYFSIIVFLLVYFFFQEAGYSFRAGTRFCSLLYR